MTVSSVVAKSAAVVDAICRSRSAMTLSEIMRETGLAKSSTHRILAILMAENLVAMDAHRQGYRIGPRLLGWAVSALRTDDLPGLADDIMVALHRATTAHVALSVLDDTAVLFLKTIDSMEPFRLAPRVGERSALHACAAGKALLAWLPDYRRSAVLARLQLERFTEHTITTKAALRQELRKVRESGWAVCDREEFLPVVGLSVPVIDHQGEAVAALSIWNIVERQDIDDLLFHGRALLDAGRALSQRLGAQ